MKLSWLIVLPVFFSCKNDHVIQQNNTDTTSTKVAIGVREVPNYGIMKANIKTYKKILLQQYPNKIPAKSIDSLQKEFVAIVIDSILPYWYGTAWDFNGTTQKPGEGSIACGYFITTVLQDAGVALNRVKLAQCASQQMIETLVTKNPKMVFSNATMETFLGYIKQQGYGLYIVGLDAHVGFLYHDGQEIYFIHAKWVNPKAVVKEVASQSGVLYYSAYKVVGKLSNDIVFLENWLRY